MPDGYNNVFGGQNRSPAQLSYVAYEIDASVELSWPFNAEDGAFIAPAKIDITTIYPALSVTMPPADTVTVGMDALIRNTGANAFVVLDQAGNTIVSIGSGEEWFIWVTESDDPAGAWGVVQFGAGSSSANAGALAGAGLRAAITRLDQHLITVGLGGDHIVNAGDRAVVLMNNGGVAVYSFPTAASLGNGWFVYVINAGSGALTLVPSGGNTIDGQSSKILNPSESCIVFSDGTALHTLGYGRSLVNTVTGASINLAPGGTVTLSPSAVKAQVQDYTGTLTSNAMVEYGTGVGYWFVWNNTTGPFSVGARTDVLDPGVIIPQGAFTILRSNGTNLDIAFTATSGTVTEVRTTVGELVGGPILSSGEIGLANTTVIPGIYGDLPTRMVPAFQVDQKGRITAANSYQLGTAAFLDIGTGPGGVPILGPDGLLPPELGGVPTGAIFDILVPGLPAGYVYLVGTIGNVGSGATNRANVDCHNLFLKYWGNASAVLAPGGKGANAEADWVALKRLTLVDSRGRTRFTRNNMLVGDSGILTPAWFYGGADTNVIGNVGGTQAEAAGVSGSFSGGGGGGTSGGLSVGVGGTTDGASSFLYGITTSGGSYAAQEHTHNWGGSFGTSGSLGVSVSVSGSISGSTAAITNVPPGYIVDTIIKL